MTTDTKLPRSLLITYGLGDFGTNIALQVTNFYLLYFFTNIVGVLPATAGILLMLGKVWDALIDPYVGSLSDNTQSRFGRRRFYFLVGGIPFAICFALLFQIPINVDYNLKVGLCFFSVIAFSTTMGLFNIPYCALTPELTRDSFERTRLTTARMALALVGTLVGAAATGAIVSKLAPDNAPLGYARMSMIYGVVIVISTLICFVGTKGFDKTVEAGEPHSFKQLVSVFKNKPFVKLLAMFCLSGCALTMMSTNMIYFVRDALKLEGTLMHLPILVLLLSTLASFPLWLFLIKKFGNLACHRAGLTGMAICILVLAFTAHFNIVWFFVLLVATGVCLGTNYICNWAMIPDCIEYDAAQTGRRREGLYYGVWLFGQKLFMAAALSTSGFMLSLIRYEIPSQPGQVVVQTPDVVFGLRILEGVIPAFLFILSVAVLKGYDVSLGKKS